MSSEPRKPALDYASPRPRESLLTTALSQMWNVILSLAVSALISSVISVFSLAAWSLNHLNGDTPEYVETVFVVLWIIMFLLLFAWFTLQQIRQHKIGLHAGK